VALDFETADYSPDSACALGLVRVENHQIVQRTYSLIKPPRRRFVFTYLHGITWEDVANQPNFGELWPTYSPMRGIDFLAALCLLRPLVSTVAVPQRVRSQIPSAVRYGPADLEHQTQS
jgi:hypothetical protein